MGNIGCQGNIMEMYTKGLQTSVISSTAMFIIMHPIVLYQMLQSHLANKTSKRENMNVIIHVNEGPLLRVIFHNMSFYLENTVFSLWHFLFWSSLLLFLQWNVSQNVIYTLSTTIVVLASTNVPLDATNILKVNGFTHRDFCPWDKAYE